MQSLISRKLAGFFVASVFTVTLSLTGTAESVILAYLGIAGVLIGGQATIDTFTARNGGPNGKSV